MNIKIVDFPAYKRCFTAVQPCKKTTALSGGGESRRLDEGAYERPSKRYAVRSEARASVFMMQQEASHLRERMTILGDLGGSSFVPWIRRHAAKLGLSHTISHADPMRIELEVAGAEELIDMMEMGCSLGPIDVWVDRIERASTIRETR